MYDENTDSPNFYLIFDEEKQLHRARLEQTLIGQYDFKVLVPLRERTFTKEDWYIDDCPVIKETILQEGSMFVSFMWNLVQHLLGSEQDIKTFLGYSSSDLNPLDDDDDEEFDD